MIVFRNKIWSTGALGLFFAEALFNGFYLHEIQQSALAWTTYKLIFTILVPLLVVASCDFSSGKVSLVQLVAPRVGLHSRMVLYDVIFASLILAFVTSCSYYFFRLIFWRYDESVTAFTQYGAANLSAGVSIINLMDAFFLVPIIEEVIYRGALFGIVAHIVAKRGIDASNAFFILSSGAFGLSHWEQGVSWLLATTIWGAVAAKLYLRLRYLLPLIVGHSLTNILMFAMWA